MSHFELASDIATTHETGTTVLSLTNVSRVHHKHTVVGDQDHCRIVTVNSVVTVHDQTVYDCQQLCFNMPECVGIMKFVEKNALRVTPPAKSTALATCTPLGEEGKELETYIRTCQGCFARCQQLHTCYGFIFNNTSMNRRDAGACETHKTWPLHAGNPLATFDRAWTKSKRALKFMQ